MSRFWLLELHTDHATDAELAQLQTTRGAIAASIVTINGCKSVTDLECVSFETLSELLLPTDPDTVKRWRREKAQALRAAREMER